MCEGRASERGIQVSLLGSEISAILDAMIQWFRDSIDSREDLIKLDRVSVDEPRSKISNCAVPTSVAENQKDT